MSGQKTDVNPKTVDVEQLKTLLDALGYAIDEKQVNADGHDFSSYKAGFLAAMVEVDTRLQELLQPSGR